MTSDLISKPPSRALKRNCHCPFESLHCFWNESHCGRTRGAMSIERRKFEQPGHPGTRRERKPSKEKNESIKRRILFGFKLGVRGGLLNSVAVNNKPRRGWPLRRPASGLVGGLLGLARGLSAINLNERAAPAISNIAQVRYPKAHLSAAPCGWPRSGLSHLTWFHTYHCSGPPPFWCYRHTKRKSFSSQEKSERAKTNLHN